MTRRWTWMRIAGYLTLPVAGVAAGIGIGPLLDGAGRLLNDAPPLSPEWTTAGLLALLLSAVVGMGRLLLLAVREATIVVAEAVNEQSRSLRGLLTDIKRTAEGLRVDLADTERTAEGLRADLGERDQAGATT